jgi:hypothetical protein
VAVSDHPGPAHPQLGSEPIEGLLGDLVTAKARQLGQALAAIVPLRPERVVEARHGHLEGRRFRHTAPTYTPSRTPNDLWA